MFPNKRPLQFSFCKLPIAGTQATITVVLWKPMARHLASIQGLRRDSGIHEEHPSEGSPIHAAVNKSFMSCKNANSSKQPPKCHYNSVTPSGAFPTSNCAVLRTGSNYTIITHRQ